MEDGRKQSFNAKKKNPLIVGKSCEIMYTHARTSQLQHLKGSDEKMIRLF